MIRLKLPHQKQSKIIRYSLLTLYVFVAFPIALLIYDSLPHQPASQYRAPSEAVVEDEPVDPLDAVKAYVNFLTAEEQYFKAHKASDVDLDKIHNMRALFSGLPEQINSARENPALSAEELAYLKQVESRLSSLQQRTLPGLRLAMKKQAQKVLWEQDVTVSVTGAGNTTIVFVGHQFAANANIKHVQNELDDLLSQLRFRVSRYQWYEGSKGWQYDFTSPPDAAVRMFKFGKFVAIKK